MNDNFDNGDQAVQAGELKEQNENHKLVILSVFKQSGRWGTYVLPPYFIARGA